MTKQHEKVLQQRWHQHVDKQADRIALSWQQVQPRKAKSHWWLASAALLIASVSYVTWQTPKQPLETTPTATAQPMLLVDNYSLTVIDNRIQQAILRGADNATLTQLWQQREQLTHEEYTL